MPTPPITKSQFKLGLECVQKLRHARAGLPQDTRGNELLRLLAEGGAAVEALHRAIEEGVFCGNIEPPNAARETMRQVGQAIQEVRCGLPRRSLYEVTIEIDGFLARIDLLRVLPDRLELVEIKSKSSPKQPILTDDRRIRSDWLSYVQDLGFQHELLMRWARHHHRELGIAANIDVCARMLVINRHGFASTHDLLSPGNYSPSYRIGNRETRAVVEYVGRPTPAHTDLICELDLDEEVSVVRENAGSTVSTFLNRGIAECMTAMVAIVDGDVWPPPDDSRSSSCKKCEFRVEPTAASGFERCWSMPDFPAHHIAELSRVGPKQFADAIAAFGPRASITDLPSTAVRDRQLRQWKSALSAHPIVDGNFAACPIGEMIPSGWSGTIWFLDFETSTYPIPSRVGGRPYEHIPFQFEGHSLPSPRAQLRDRTRLAGFLELADPDPRRKFVDELCTQFPGNGPIFHWHRFERTVLNAIKASLAQEPLIGDKGRHAFIDSLVGPGGRGGGRLVDLLPIAERAFYHPELRGSYSIKRVVPIAWAMPAIRAEFMKGHGAAGDPDCYSGATDPYDGLPAPPRALLEELGGDSVIRKIIAEDEGGSGVRNGGMAMLTYHYARMFGGEHHKELQAQLRRYCRLDSAAMVMVYGLMRDVVGSWPRA